MKHLSEELLQQNVKYSNNSMNIPSSFVYISYRTVIFSSVKSVQKQSGKVVFKMWKSKTTRSLLLINSTISHPSIYTRLAVY